MDKKNETTKPILNHKRRQLLIGAALTPVVMTLHSAKVFAQDGTLHEGVSGPAPFSGAIRGSAGMESSGGTIETENALYTAICTSGNATLADYYGSIGQNGSVPTQLSDFQGWSSSSAFRWQSSNSTGSVNWTPRYEAMLVAAVDQYISGHSENINTILTATWKSDAVRNAQTAISSTDVAQPVDWNNTPFTVSGSEGVRAYYHDWPDKLRAFALEAYNALPDTEPAPDPEPEP